MVRDVWEEAALLAAGHSPCPPGPCHGGFRAGPRRGGPERRPALDAAADIRRVLPFRARWRWDGRGNQLRPDGEAALPAPGHPCRDRPVPCGGLGLRLPPLGCVV